jgi:DNA recombination protein RmuC
MEIIFLLIGLVVGIVIGILLLRSKTSSLQVKLEEKETSLMQKEELLNNFKSELDSERNKVLNLTGQIAALQTENKNLGEKLAEQKSEIDELYNKFKTEFENLANEILENKSKKFTEQNQQNIDSILLPLKEKISEFEKRVNDIHTTESKDLAALQEQIKNLHSLNQQMTQEAKNLTNALKGDTQKQGSWGELILESILEKSGLVKNREFFVQNTFRDAENKLLRPDVIVKLPEDKNIIIDSKVSLTAYEQFCSSENETNKNNALKNHLNSVRSHVKELSLKEYYNLYNINSLDYVLMFIPIESAFSLAVQNEPSIFNEAFEKNIIIVSPANLFATLRTIANIWKQEKQNKNALEIAKKSGELYDKFVSFLEDFKKIGVKIDDAKKSYDESYKKLYVGRGNLIDRAENIKLMGAKTTKSIDKSLIDLSTDVSLDNSVDSE